MPGMDKTGPTGSGPMTGGGRGICDADAAGRGVLRGCGRWARRGGFGRGMGFCLSAADDRDLLSEQKTWLEQSLKNVNDRLEKL